MAEQWRLYQNDQQVCSGTPTVVASADNNSNQIGSCTTSLQLGSNNFYVLLCNFDSSGNGLCSQSISETINYQEQTELGAIYLQGIPDSTSDSKIYVSWAKEEGANGDHWRIYHDDAQVCSGNLLDDEESFVQSAGCDVALVVGTNKLQAELCQAQPTGTDDICTYSASLSTTFSEDPARVLATPYIVDPEEVLPAEYDTSIAWIKDTSGGSAGEDWALSNNGIIVCEATIAGDVSNASCVVNLVAGSNSLQVQLCTDATTYSGATCRSSTIVTVEAFDPNPLEPGIIDITNNVAQLIYEPELALEWRIVSGNDVSYWRVDHNDEQHCATGGDDSSADKYYSNGSCLLDLELGNNTISVTGCNYGYQNSETCSSSLEIGIEYAVLPGAPEITSSFPTTTYVSEHNLSWERFEGEAADYWLGMVNDTSKCSGDLLRQTPQSGSCAIQLDSGFNIINARLCLANESGSAYCIDSAAEQVELLAPVPAHPEISTPAQTIADDIIQLKWSKSSGDNGSYWSVINNSASVSACSDQPLLSSGSSQSGNCNLPLELGANVVSVHLCNNNAAGTSSCSTSESVTITREPAAPEFTSTTSVSSAENNSAVFYTAAVSDNDSSIDQISFSLSGADAALFSIDSSGGLAFGSAADYEAPQDLNGDNVYQLSITATDQTNLADQLDLSVSVTNANDIAPEFSSVASVSVVENTSGVIHSAQATDAEGDNLAYYLAGADASHFSLNSSSGELAFLSAPDYESPQDQDRDNIYQFDLIASDSVHSTAQAFSIKLSDSNDESPQATSLQSIALDLSSISLGSTVYTVTASDADAGDQLSYSHSGADANHFSLDSSSGDLAFIVLPSAFDTAALDANGDGVYQLDISISDLASNSSSFALTVAVVDDVGMYPKFDLRHDSASISENSSASFYTAVAVDPEGEDVAYSLNGADSSHFAIDSVSGELRPVAPLDYENPLDSGLDNNYSLTILASDPLGNQSQQTLDVLVGNANDNSPSFSAPSVSISVTENHTTSVYSADASDADGDSLIYSILGTDASHFTIDSSSGVLAFSILPDHENPQDSNSDNTYELTVTASDSATSAEQSLSIVVEDSNDNSPSFGLASDSVSVSENGDTFIYTALATDADSSDQISYSLAGADASHFSLNSSSGALSSLSPFDFESPLDANGDNTYELAIVATDGSTDSILSLGVSVSNLNDNLPSFALESDSLSVSENTSGNIYTAIATDLDGANSLAYSLLGADANDFSIDAASGALSFITAPDFEQPTDGNQDNQYELEIRASDGINSASLDLEVIVSNVNDIAPVFAHSSHLTEFTESATGIVYTAVASDSEGDSITYSIQGIDASYFGIDSASGVLAFHNAPDFENPIDQDRDNHYQLDIAAGDGANSSSLALTVAVQDINDNAPSFAAASESISVSENTSATIYTAAASDPDATDSLAYSLSGADAHLFTINSSSGALSFSDSPNFEAPADQGGDNHYQLDIEAFDGAQSAFLSLTVVVEDMNDNSPSFAQSSRSLAVAENTGGTIYTAAATDADAIDSLTYSLQGTDAHNFSIHYSSGALAFSSAPDYEQPTDQNGDQHYHLEVKASDGTYSAILSIEVEVSNLNDNAPSFAAASESIELPESSSGTVYSGAASDLDGDAITYSLSGIDFGFFAINSSSGALNLASALDFESPQDQDGDNTYELEIAASDGLSSASLALSIELSDVNDNAPSFAQSSEALTMPENSSGVFYTASASDPDISDSLAYSIQGADAQHFSINGSSGELALPNALDFENPLDQGGNNIYELSISASDGTYSASLSLTITVEDRDDKGPSFAQLSDAITVAESVSGSIYTASASDPNGDLITYSLAGADASHFSLDSSSGLLSLPNALDFESPLDQNSDNHYQLEISATDGGSSAILSLSVELSDVNDNPPSFAAQSASITVAENTSTSFYTASASDPDATASLSYSLSGADASLFTINAGSGELTFGSAPDFDNPLDFDRGNDYELDIGVSDGANSASLQLTVQVSNVNDSSPVFTSTPSQVTFSEASSASVYTAAATDPDADSITYSVGGTDASFFSMDSSSGVLSFRAAPDFEIPQDQDGNNDYELEIQASDSLKSTSFDLIVIVEDANDNAPSFATASDSLAVFEGNSSIIYTASASDPDATAVLTYSLVGSDANHFSIQSSSGALSFATAPDFETPLDQGADNEYQLTIIVSDGQHSATLDLLVKVEDTNDNAPSFASASASVSFPENSSGVVYTAQATDLDASASIIYSFSASSSDSSLFALNSSSGAVSLLNPLDSEQPIDSNGDNAYQLSITASDGTYSASLDLSVSISDVNDNAPSFDPASANVSVSENSSSVIYTAIASDPDSSAVLSYSLLSGLDASHFGIEASSGALSFVNAPDFEIALDQDGNNAYELAISVSDGLASASLSLSVVVIDANDNAPVFALGADSVSVPENTTGSVYVAAATDPDAIDSLVYSLSGSDTQWLSIDPSSGAIAFTSPPDFEAPQDSNQDNTYELVINASDGSNSASQELNVSVSNLSDSAPIFSMATDTVALAENSSGVIYTALATDPDGDSLSYDLNGTDASSFSIDSASGALSFVAAPDFEAPQDSDQDNTYELNIIASDGVSSASLALTLSVTDVNDNEPQFPQSAESISVFEDSTGRVYTAQATDPDISDSITYSISGTDASLLIIDPVSGALTFLSPPDFENPSDADSDNVYELSITASDGANSAQLSLKATVINLNDNAPRFAAMSDLAVADENGAASFYTALATDPEGGTLSYSLSSGDAALFSIDSASGELAFRTPPDFENPTGQYADNNYEFNITADDGTYLGEMILTVTVADLNDNAPSFSPDSASATLVENSTNVFYQATADDPDTVGALTYSLVGLDSAHFIIDPASGELSAITGLDFEQPSDADQDNTYEFDITVSDGIASASLALTVAVSNVNDTAPTFSVTTESVDFTEHSIAVVYTAVATDPEGDPPSYSISGADSSKFAIDTVSGVLSFKTPPDYEVATDHNSDNIYELDIIASDGVNSASFALTVAVQDINDNTPSFTPSNESISVAENKASSIYTAKATDLDATDILTYSISGTDSSKFSINSVSGALAFNSAPDFEKPSDSNQDNAYELSITASDGTNQGAQALTITVTNVNEPLSFTTTSVNLTTAENNLSFTHIVEAALDEDQGQQLSYQLSGADQSAFSLDSATRALSFANTPDYENPADQDSNNAYQVDIIASDGEYESSQSIAISISDVNDEAPQFTSSDLQTVDYAMVQVGDVVYTAAATDADAGDQISFSISGADATNFDFDSSTGELSFKQLTAPADAPANGIITYNLTITATDLAGNSSDLAFSISVIYNIPPTASISAVQSAYEGDIVELDGSASSDPDGSIVSYSWQQIDNSGYSVNLSDSSVVNPSFTVPEVTAANIELIFELTVTDDEGSKGSASVIISIIYNNPPVAEAGDDQDILESDIVELDASASSDSDGSIVSYSWQQIDNSGHTITLSDPNTTKPSFTAPKVAAGTSLILIFQLTVTDDRGKSSQDSVTLSVIYNNPPIADAGQNFAADEGISVELDGSASSDSEDSALAYSWQQVDSSGYSLTLDDPNSATPSFITPIVSADTELIFQLTVTDSLGKSSDANVSISVIYNIPPIANSGTDQTVYEGDSVALDGSSSSDSEGSTLTYLWQQVDSSGYAITLNNADTAKPTFITPNPIGADTELIFQLTVTDSLGKSADANATISVIYNHPPIANSGSDQTVYEGDSVGLDGTASSDSEGTALTYLWQQVDSSGYAIALNNADTAKPTFIAPNPVAADTDLIFQLTVTDGFGKSADANATISVIYNHPPVANAGTDRTVFESITISLDGNASSDSENSSLSYFWQQLDSSGHSVNLSDATAAQPTFTAPDVDIDVEAYIELIFQLTVTDERGKSSDAIVTLTVVNNEPPIADAGADHTLYESNTVQLDGSSSSDIEDTSLNYSWQQIDSSGYSVSFSDATSAQPSFIAPDVTADANLTFQLTVTDAGSKSSTDTVTITVLYAPTFTVSVSPDNTQVAGTIASLRGATQGSHLIESYLWEETTDYGLVIDRADSTNASFVVPDYLYANYDVLSFQFTATDAAGISVSATTVINIGVASNLKWHYDIDSKVHSSPAIGPDGAVYFGAGEKTFHVVYSEDGSLKWKFIAENSFEAPPTIGADGTVYIGDVGGILYALTAPTDGSQSGIEKWRYEFASHSFTEYSSVSIAADGTLHIGVSDGFLYALDPDSGKLKWSYELEHNGDAILASTAISSEGNIYFASALGHMYAVKPPSDGGSTGELYWRYDTRAYATWTNPAIDDYGYVYNGSWGDGMYQFDYRSGRYIYRFPANKDVHASAAIGAGDIIYFGSEDDKMYAYNARGRNREWKYETGSDSIYSSGGGDIFSAPVIGANGRLYFGSADDYLYALDAAKGEYKWAHDVMGTRWNDDQDVKNSIAKNSSPALAPDGTLFIGVGDGLYAIHTRAPGLAADAPWPKFGQNNLNTGRANLKPSADAGSEQTVAAGATVNLDASASSDPDGAIINYYWRETSGYGINIIGNSSAQARFTAPTPSGNYTLTIELVVTDNHGRTDTATLSINIEI